MHLQELNPEEMRGIVTIEGVWQLLPERAGKFVRAVPLVEADYAVASLRWRTQQFPIYLWKREPVDCPGVLPIAGDQPQACELERLGISRRAFRQILAQGPWLREQEQMDAYYEGKMDLKRYQAENLDGKTAAAEALVENPPWHEIGRTLSYLIDANVFLRDVHANNVGWRDRTLVIFDPGHTGSTYAPPSRRIAR
jgi:hypothetical protein